MAGTAAGLSEDETVAIRENRVDFDPKLAALLAVAREATGNVGEVDDQTWQSASCTATRRCPADGSLSGDW